MLRTAVSKSSVTPLTPHLHRTPSSTGRREVLWDYTLSNSAACRGCHGYFLASARLTCGPRSRPPVRCRRALLSRPTQRRRTPIVTTELSFVVRLDSKGVMSVRFLSHACFRRDTKGTTG